MKISNLFSTEAAVKNGKYFKWLLILLCGLLVIMTIALIKFYFEVNKNSPEKKSENAAVTEFDENENGYKTFENEDGKIGVTDKDGRVVIKPEWNNAFCLGSDRFIVSVNVGGTDKMGIIDIDENIISPFIFNKFEAVSPAVSKNPGIIKGYVSEENGYIIFDSSGNLLNGRIWDDVSETDGQISLTKGNDSFSAMRIGTKISVTSADMIRNADGRLIYVKTKDSTLLTSAETETLSRIMDISSEYLDALMNGKKDTIAGLTEEQYYSALAENNIFDSCNINKIYECTISVNNGKNAGDDSYVFSSKADYDYIAEDTEIKNIVSEISLNIVKNSQGKFIIRSISKTDL